MILTIGMIVKNEEKYLRSCLEAISPILRQLDSELIITDTGSEDSTMEIARDFTNNVFSFEWCNDFSAARNSALDKAQGEWFMSLDADEVFENVTEIIDFFNTGAYKKYASATYVIRNFNSEDRTTYSDFDAIRLIKKTKGTRYTGKVHETLPKALPTARLASVANHYGYLTENNSEFIKKKSQRNLDLLFLELERNPENCRLYYEIGQTYCLTSNFKTALEYFNKGIHWAKEQKNRNLIYLFADIARVHYTMRHYQEVLHITSEYFSFRNENGTIDLQMYFLEAGSYAELGEYKEAISSYKKYINAIKAYRKGSYSTTDASQYTINFIDDFNYRIACMNLVRTCINDGDFTAAKDFISSIPLTDWVPGEDTLKMRITLELDLMKATANFDSLPLLLDQASGEAIPFLQISVEALISDKVIRDPLLNSIASLDSDGSDYIRLLKLRHDFFCKRSIDRKPVELLLSDIKDWSPIYADVIYFGLYCDVNIPLMASAVNAYDLNQFLFDSRFLHFTDTPQLIWKKIEKHLEYKDIPSQLWLSFLYLWALTSEQLSQEQLLRLFNAYTETVNNFLYAVYKKELLSEENLALFPQHLRVGYYCCLASDALKSGEKSKYVDCLKKIIQLFPDFKRVIEALLEDFQKNLNTASQKSDLSEFEKYAIVVKENINKLIAAGQLDQASQLLNSYLQLCPDDPEVVLIRKRLEASKK